MAGTFTKVTVNAKGLVTKGEALVASDIPSLNSFQRLQNAGTAAAADTGIARVMCPFLALVAS